MGDIEKPPAYAEREPARSSVVLRIASAIADVPAADWDACARGAEPPQLGASYPANPLISHAFLRALEESGSAAQD
ncbi:MAG: GNAT family N-acetyltransferase, partial [Methyloceanibacter sp.]|nr:GNAT family N-acetyltransferase [Methyloceanibacter sp.]